MKAIIVGLKKYNDLDFEESFYELRQLAITCDFEVVAELTQKQNFSNPKSYVNSGKLSELSEVIEEFNCGMVIFNEELTGMQYRYLEKNITCEIYDRTKLILYIFAAYAKTKEAILQVSLAKKQYDIAHLVGGHQQLYSQQGGSGFRGGGERQLEIDRRILRKQMSILEKELGDIVKQRGTQRKQRSHNNLKQVALVGYTNSGKSSLMNVLVRTEEKKVVVQDRLFATLQTASRMVDSQPFSYLLTDTVGFIRDLPTCLIKAFRSTLEEIGEADLLLMVIDISNPNYVDQINATQNILQELNWQDIPLIYVYNKADLLVESPDSQLNNSILISCETNYNIDKLRAEITNQLFDLQKVKLHIKYDDFVWLNSLQVEEKVLRITELDECVEVTANIQNIHLKKYQHLIIK